MPYTSQHSFPTRRSSDLERPVPIRLLLTQTARDDIEKIADVSIVTPSGAYVPLRQVATFEVADGVASIVREGNIRSEEHTSELQSREKLVCRLLHDNKKT